MRQASRNAGWTARVKANAFGATDFPKLLEKVVSATLDDEHRNQAVAQKILMDRILPVSTFEKQFDYREKIIISVIGKESETLEGEGIER